VPEEEFKGDNPPKNGFVDAETFVKTGEQINGKLKSKIERLEADVSSLRQTNVEFGKYKDEQLAKTKRDMEVRIRELEDERSKAITEGDGQTFTRADAEINNLRSQESQPKASNPEGDAWVAQNPWYGSNNKLTSFADGEADRIISEGYSGQAYWKELTRRTQEAFPEEFGNPNRGQPSSVETGGARQASEPKPRSYDALPDDAKAACERFVAQGLTTKEDYVATFDWDD
jgi:hypothetical protein